MLETPCLKARFKLQFVSVVFFISDGRSQENSYTKRQSVKDGISGVVSSEKKTLAEQKLEYCFDTVSIYIYGFQFS